jgi:hypothetical protein
MLLDQTVGIPKPLDLRIQGIVVTMVAARGDTSCVFGGPTCDGGVF